LDRVNGAGSWRNRNNNSITRALPEKEHHMAEKVKELKLERDYKANLYFLDGQGNVCAKAKSGSGNTVILVEHAVVRDNKYLYFIDKDGDISRTARGPKTSQL
jgi:hypothetical protein